MGRKGKKGEGVTKNGEEREIFVECGVDLGNARGLTYKPFLRFLKERKRKKKNQMILKFEAWVTRRMD